jgi:GNAT superfamily N-acetyltransferase
MIREANEADIPDLLALAERSIERGQLPCGFDAGTMEQTLRFLMDSDDGFIFVSDNGAVGGLAHPHPFNAAHKTGTELFWWADSGGRELFDAMEERVRALGCHSWMMIALESMRPTAVGALYRRRGYAPVEHSYMKVL